jgi:Tol biopolymer transport system component
MRRAWLALGALGGVLACAEWAGPRLGGPRLSIVPVFSVSSATVLVNDLDRLRIVLQSTAASRGAPPAVDTTVAVDTAGDAKVTLPVLLTGAAQTYTVQLQGIRSADAAVLYTGFDTVTVVASQATRVDSVPVAYVGPCQPAAGCVVIVGPQNQAIKAGGSLVMTVTVDSVGVPVANVPVRLRNVTPGLITLASDLSVTAVSGTSCGPARVAADLSGASDTLRLAVNAPVTIPAILFAGDSSGVAAASGGVICANTNGTGRFTINGTVGDATPRWSPDRERVAYTVYNGAYQFWVARWAGDTTVFIAGDTASGAFTPRWSPTGSHLAWGCGSAFSAVKVCVIPNAAIPLTQLGQTIYLTVTDSVPQRPTGPGAFAWDPLQPDRIAFVRDTFTATQRTASAIYVANFDGSGVTRLTPDTMDFGSGVLSVSELEWSPRGDVIVFTATDTLFQSKLYAINRDGTGLRRLTTGPDYDSGPVVSPAGTEVVFARSLVSACSVDYWRIGIDGTGAQPVTSEAFCDISSSSLGKDWSPDGTEIVLVGRGPLGGFTVYRLPAATTAATYATGRVSVRDADPGAFLNDIQPSWRP